jgi:asparagine synthase (glutamine-hydrolysing)
MCGIVALHGPDARERIAALNDLIVHRGPDDAGIFVDAASGVALAMRRLSIVDLAGGHQPMTTADGRWTIVYNGEVFNAPALRAALAREGAAFRTDHSDTEVVLELWARRGPQALESLNGFFGFVLYDAVEKALYAARDRFGIKPLYYGMSGGSFALASELKALLGLPGAQPEVDRQSLFHYASLQYVPGARSAFSGIERLPAGCWLRHDLASGRTEVRRWWSPRFGLAEAPQRTRAEWTEVLRDGFEAAVKRWSLSDVPVGCSLSGGLDSSGITAVLARAQGGLRTYSVGFTGAGEAAWNELPLARRVAEKWGTQHAELVLDPEALLEDLLQMVWHLDEPYAGGLPSWTVFKFMGRDVKVGFTGTGGDELFGNYGKWRQLEGGPLARLMRRAPDLDAFRARFFDRYYYAADADKRGALFAFRVDDLQDTAELLYGVYQECASAALRNRIAYTDICTQLADEFLAMTDRFSMAHSLEARTPLLDHEFAALALSVPPGMRTARGDLKGLWRDTLGDLLPAELLSAPKRGFVIPLGLWLRGPLRPLAERLLEPRRLAAQGILRPDFAERYLVPHVAGARDHTQQIWSAIMLQLWHRVFVEERGRKPDYDWKALAA